MAEKHHLVLAYGYLVGLRHDPDADAFGAVPTGITAGYYVGSTAVNPGGQFCDLGNLGIACATAAEASAAWDVLVDMNFEGPVRTKTMDLLLQPIQDNPANYKSVEELVDTYRPKQQLPQ
ncbi:hypothetical protein HYX12_02595 [Candidatus Woesearchaeota archaeon]|nr:hypothetical protein [Candidatus Woesearchaeota archaeon]